MLVGYKTYIGIAITIIGALSSLFGWHIGDFLAGVEDQLVVLVGSAIAIYGRWKASRE